MSALAVPVHKQLTLDFAVKQARIAALREALACIRPQRGVRNMELENLIREAERTFRQ